MKLLMKFIEVFKAKLTVELSAKTGWGRNEVQQAVQRALDAALVDVLGVWGL